MKMQCALGLLLMGGSLTYASQGAGEKSATIVKIAQEQKAAPAGTTGTAAIIDPAKRADIVKLLEVTGTRERVTQAMGEMEKSIKPLMTQALPAGEYREKLVELFFERFHSKFDAQRIIELAIPEYDKYFSDEELKGLIQFYETPLGKKSVSVIPQLTQELMDASRKQGEALGRASMMEVLDEHPDLKKQLEDTQKPAAPQ